jgi:Lrp/AsnC family leucine-responsive transcriptional regulator
MDELDDKILEKLNENARKSYREIARELNVSLTTVSNRIKKLEDEKVIERHILLINQEKLVTLISFNKSINLFYSSTNNF